MTYSPVMKRHRRHRFRAFQPVLRPAPGRELPPELRIGQVERLAEALPQGIEDPGFELLLRRIDGAPFFGGNEVEVYFEGRSAFGAMRDAVRAAQQEILLESYIFKDDSTGRQFLGEIQAAADRGIKVRVLADAVGSYETKAEFWQEMESHGIEFFLFHPLFKSMWYQPFRDHRKILVVDREVAFTGGMNIGEEYGSWRRRPKPGETWRDTHVRIQGPAAWEMAVVFSEGWIHAGGAEFEIDPLPAAAAEAPGVRILVLDSRPKRGQAESAAVMAAVAAAAQAHSLDHQRLLRPRAPGDLGAGRGGVPGGGRPSPAAGQVRRADRPAGGTRPLRPAARAGGADLRVPAGHPPRQDPGGGWPRLYRGLDEPRLPLFPLQLRVRRARPRRRDGGGDGESLSHRPREL